MYLCQYSNTRLQNSLIVTIVIFKLLSFNKTIQTTLGISNAGHISTHVYLGISNAGHISTHVYLGISNAGHISTPVYLGISNAGYISTHVYLQF